MAKKDNEEIPFAASPSAGNSEKLKALQAAMDKIEKTFGKGSIMKMGDDNVQEVEVIPTGSIALNAASSCCWKNTVSMTCVAGKTERYLLSRLWV